MTVKDFMLAHEGEAGMAKKLTPEYLTSQGVTLSDEELEMATGGRVPIGYIISLVPEVYRRDANGNATHWQNKKTGKIFYYACPRCKRVTHLGAFGYVYCDPCDTYWTTTEDRKVYIN